MKGIVWRDEFATQVRLGLLRIMVWRQPRQWMFFTRRWVLSCPAHAQGHIPFGERYGYRRAYHALGACLSERGSRR